MKAIPDLIALHDSRPGVRALVQVEIREPEFLQKETKVTKNAEGGDTVLDFIASTATLDRYHEIIEPCGWRLDAYRRNPVFQNAHNYGDVLFTLGKALITEVRAVGDKKALCQRIQFATEVNPVARIAYGLYKGGFLNAVSVGFIPVRWEDGDGESREQGAGSRERGSSPRRRYLEQELLEVSAVAIPANPDALMLGVKSGAVVKADLEAAVELLRSLVGAASAQMGSGKMEPPGVGWYGKDLMDLARELGRVMRRA